MQREGSFKEFVRYALWNILGMIGISCYILADTFFVSKGLGTAGLAALNLAIPVYSFIHGSGMMLGMGAATRYTIYQSQGQKKQANTIFTTVIYLGVAFTIFYFLIGIFLAEPIAEILGADEQTFSMTYTYLRVLLLFSPAFLFHDILLCFVRNDGQPKLSMAAMVTGSLSNILLDYVFIFPLQMGIFGAVLATSMAPIIGISVLSRHWWKKRNRFHLIRIKIHKENVSRILILGFPSFIAELSSGIVIIVFNMIILGLQGNIGVAAYGVIANLSLVVVSLYTGLSQGVQPLISRAYGSGNQAAVNRFLFYAITSVLVTSCIVYFMVFTFAQPITAAFNNENNLQLQQIAVSGLKLYFTSVWFVGFNILICVFFTSVNYAFPAHVISLARGLVVIVPMAFLFSYSFGMLGVWLAFPATELIVFLFGMVLYIIWKKRRASENII